MAYVHRYYVVGSFAFPDDMLRYDQARIVECVQERDAAARKWGVWLIEGKTAPTIGRWQSFLFTVVETNEQAEKFDLDPSRLVRLGRDVGLSSRR